MPNESDAFEDDFEIRFDAGRREPEDRDEREGMYAEGRRTDRTYASKSFGLLGAPGVPARFVEKVFDPEDDTQLEPYGEGEVWLVRESPKGRVQLKLLVAREQGHVSKIWLQRVTYPKGVARAENVLSLSGSDAERLIELIRNLEYIPVEGEESVRVDDALVRQVFTNPGYVAQLYERDPEFFARLISGDAGARDVVALQRRRADVERFKRLLDDEDFFDEQVPLTPHKRAEDVRRPSSVRTVTGAGWTSPKCVRAIDPQQPLVPIGCRRDARTVVPAGHGPRLSGLCGRVHRPGRPSRRAAHPPGASGNAFGTVRQRLTRHLLDIAAEHQVGIHLAVPLTGQALADAVGTAREVVARAPRDLRDAGIVRNEQRTIVIVRPDQLEDVAHSGRVTSATRASSFRH